MAGFFAERRKAGEDWEQIGGPYPTQERAKAECKAYQECDWFRSAAFRTVADDEVGTVYQECFPPHAWRLRWTNASAGTTSSNIGLCPRPFFNKSLS